MKVPLRRSFVLAVALLVAGVTPRLARAQEAPARFVDEQTAAVIRFDVDKIDVNATAKWLAGAEAGGGGRPGPRLWPATAPGRASTYAPKPGCTPAERNAAATVRAGVAGAASALDGRGAGRAASFDDLAHVVEEMLPNLPAQ